MSPQRGESVILRDRPGTRGRSARSAPRGKRGAAVTRSSGRVKTGTPAVFTRKPWAKCGQSEATLRAGRREGQRAQSPPPAGGEREGLHPGGVPQAHLGYFLLQFQNQAFHAGALVPFTGEPCQQQPRSGAGAPVTGMSFLGGPLCGQSRETYAVDQSSILKINTCGLGTLFAFLSFRFNQDKVKLLVLAIKGKLQVIISVRHRDA